MMGDKDIEEFHNIGKAIKKNSKYNYLDATRIEEHGTRLYDVNGTRLPSVTTILGKTKDQQFIKDWKAKVGEKEADRIKNLSSNRGTAMHKFLEHYILGTGYDDLTRLGQEAKAMAEKVIEYGLTPVEECHNGLETIVDFKQSNRPKKKEWIEDYYLQIAAYAMAHDYVHGSEIRQGVIMMCTPDLYYQEFRITDHELRSYKHKFLKRLDMYHELIYDEKERAKVELRATDFTKNEQDT